MPPLNLPALPASPQTAGLRWRCPNPVFYPIQPAPSGLRLGTRTPAGAHPPKQPKQPTKRSVGRRCCHLRPHTKREDETAQHTPAPMRRCASTKLEECSARRESIFSSFSSAEAFWYVQRRLLACHCLYCRLLHPSQSELSSPSTWYAALLVSRRWKCILEEREARFVTSVERPDEAPRRTARSRRAASARSLPSRSEFPLVVVAVGALAQPRGRRVALWREVLCPQYGAAHLATLPPGPLCGHRVTSHPTNSSRPNATIGE